MNHENQHPAHDPESAKAQLHLAHQLSQNIGAFSLAWISYVGLCAGGAMLATGSYLSSDSISPIIFSLVWIVVSVAILVPISIKQSALRCGFSKRWGSMMGLWTVAWALTVALTPSLLTTISLFTTYLLLIVIGVFWEAKANQVSA